MNRVAVRRSHEPMFPQTSLGLFLGEKGGFHKPINLCTSSVVGAGAKWNLIFAHKYLSMFFGGGFVHGLLVLFSDLYLLVGECQRRSHSLAFLS